jgi:hypothetical protein
MAWKVTFSPRPKPQSPSISNPATGRPMRRDVAHGLADGAALGTSVGLAIHSRALNPAAESLWRRRSGFTVAAFAQSTVAALVLRSTVAKDTPGVPERASVTWRTQLPQVMPSTIRRVRGEGRDVAPPPGRGTGAGWDTGAILGSRRIGRKWIGTSATMSAWGKGSGLPRGGLSGFAPILPGHSTDACARRMLRA